jgi:tetratricopeptide (TPR) repeat protein
MESYRLDSRIMENEKEFLIQTINDTQDGVIKTSLFANGELLDSIIMTHSEAASNEAVLDLVKSTHSEKKSELEYLLKSYQEVLKEGRPEMMYHLGTALYYKRMYAEARQLFGAAAKLKYDYHEAYYYLSLTELALKHSDGAIKAGTKAVELRPHFADYHNILGEAFLASDSCKRAVIEFEEAIKLNIYYADAYLNLAIAFILNAVTKEDFNMFSDLSARTVEMLNKAILIFPEYKNATYDEAFMELGRGELKRALTLFQAVREEKKEKIRREKINYFHRFLIYTDWISQSNIIERINFLEREINRNPSYVDLYHELAICYLQQAKFGWQKSIEYFRKALEINPKFNKAKKAIELSEEHYLRLNDAIVDIIEKND